MRQALEDGLLLTLNFAPLPSGRGSIVRTRDCIPSTVVFWGPRFCGGGGQNGGAGGSSEKGRGIEERPWRWRLAEKRFLFFLLLLFYSYKISVCPTVQSCPVVRQKREGEEDTFYAAAK